MAEHKVPMTQEEWDERYASRPEGIWSGNPNPVLVAELADLTPGTALDVGCGEGADALWLAARRWRVTGVDISRVALERAAAQAKIQGLSVEWQQADLRLDPPAPGTYDLVTAHFMHLPQPERSELYAHLAAAVTPGGTLLIAAHHPHDLHTSAHRPDRPDLFFTQEDVAGELDPDAWDVVVCESRPRRQKDPDGHDIEISDAVVRAVRRPGAASSR